VDALRRGWIGLALFSAALVLMPVLVFAYDKHASVDRASGTASLQTAAHTPLVDPLGPAVSPPPTGVGLSFAGVRNGETIFGFRRIQVESNSYGGPLEYVLNGPIPPYQLALSRPPYLFSPQTGGWLTTAVPNGLYTLTAIPTEVANAQISITFTVSNYPSMVGR
jgi:hypothetical protein